jgi:tetratricopeptide (TPR) repeat protein
MTRLAGKARADGPTGWNVYAALLGESGRHTEAQRELEALVARHPDHVEAWLNLASAHFYQGRLQEALDTLERCPDVSGAPGSHLVGSRTEGLRTYMSFRTRDRELLELRVAALRERAAAGTARDGDTAALARALGTLWGEHRAAPAEEVAEAAREAHTARPADVTMLELLVRALHALRGQSRRPQPEDGEAEEFDKALRKLERLAPHSRLLEALRSVPLTEPEQATPGEEAWTLVNELISRAMLGDAQAADGVRRLTERFPEEPSFRMVLMMLAMRDGLADGDLTKAVALAEGLAAEPDERHETHFNLGQVYWYAGSRERAFDHLRRAYELARDDQERDDVVQVVRMLLARSGDDPAEGSHE